ncbi:hypothetical protein [Streptomyces sp. NPDC051662]|uniref:hypothetical protein n=1 Tax=Streptomyces sp. NPDC051662 TaxID=3154750 RepID=UPI003427969F
MSEDLMIPSKTALPTITPAGTYGQLVQLLTAATQLDDEAAENLAEAMLDQLGLYSPAPEPVDGVCTAMFYDADPENEGWVQCDRAPGHVRRRSPLHSNRCNSVSWSDDHRQALPADISDGG